MYTHITHMHMHVYMCACAHTLTHMFMKEETKPIG